MSQLLPVTALPVLDESLAPIMVGRRQATAQEARAISALNAVLDDQPAPPKTLFDPGQLPHLSADWRRQRPGLARARLRHTQAEAVTTNTAGGAAALPLLDALLVPTNEVQPQVHPQVQGDDAYSEDYTPPFVAPGFVRPAAAPATTRDEALALAREVQVRAGDVRDDRKVQEAAQQAMVDDAMPFGAATLRLFCC